MKRSNIVGVNNQLEVEKSDDVIAGIDQLSPENKPLKILRFLSSMSPVPFRPAPDARSAQINEQQQRSMSSLTEGSDFTVALQDGGYQAEMVGNESLRRTGLCKMNLLKTRGKRTYMMSMLLLPMLPIIALIVQYSLTLKDLLQYQFEVQDGWLKVDGATHLEKFITNLQRERSEVAFHIFTYGKQSLALNLSERFTITDEALETMPWPKIKNYRNDEQLNKKQLFKSKLRFQIRHGDFRERISQAEEDITSILNWYNTADATFLYHLSTEIKTTNSSSVWRYMIAYTNLLRCIENLGIAGAYGIRYYGQGKITHDNYVQLIRHFTLVDEYLDQSKNYVPQIINKKDYDSIRNGKDFKALSISRKKMLARVPQEPNTREALSFYESLWKYTEDLRVVLEDLRLNIEQIVDEEMNAANQQMAFGVTSLVLVLMISPIIIVLVRSATATIQIFSRSLSKKALELKNEKGKAKSLLFETLPKHIAFEYTQTSERKNYAENFDCVTIFYSDVVEFLRLCEDFTPMDVGIFLNALCRMFDSRIDKYEVFKLQSENDAYMIASGIHLATAAKLGDSHASEMATMALDIMSGASYFVIPNKPKEKLRLRIGIHSGPAVGGVQKAGDYPRYRLLGYTLELATRVNGMGKPMKILISLDTKELLESCGGFKFERHGTFDTQSKFLPRIDTYWLLQEEGEEERNWDLDLDLNSEANYEANIMPDYIKELILPNEAKDMKTLNEDMNNSGDYI